MLPRSSFFPVASRRPFTFFVCGTAVNDELLFVDYVSWNGFRGIAKGSVLRFQCCCKKYLYYELIMESLGGPSFLLSRHLLPNPLKAPSPGALNHFLTLFSAKATIKGGLKALFCLDE
jgi:hypothetical protein